jgi:hypothetical protein
MAMVSDEQVCGFAFLSPAASDPISKSDQMLYLCIAFAENRYPLFGAMP